MKKIIKDHYVPFILLLVSIAMILPYWKKGYVLALGESEIYLNPSYINYYSSWAHKFNLGSYSYHQNNIFLFSIIWFFLNMFSFIIHPSILFTFLSFFLPAFFFYFCVDNIFKYKNKIYYLPASILYSFNVFRTLGPINERVNLLFIFLPLFFLFYYKLIETKKWLYVFTLVIVSLLSSSLSGNPPLLTIPYLLMATYFIYHLFTIKFKIDKITIIQNLTLLLLIILANLFWFFPLSTQLLHIYKTTNAGSSQFTALNFGNLFDHFRLIGSWAWRDRYYLSLYYPFSTEYDKFFLILSTYFVSIFSFIYLFKKNKNSFQIYFLFLSLISYLLLSGTKGPFGFIYQFLYDNNPLFKMFREPFLKFTFLYIFAIAFGLLFSVVYVRQKIKNDLIVNFIIMIITIAVLINAYPLFNTQAMPIGKWNAGQSSYVLKVPDYWLEAKKYIEKNLSDERLMVLPYNNYSGIYNWELGTNLVGNATDFLINVSTIKAWDTDQTVSGKVIKLLIDPKNNNINLKYNLGFLNSRYLLQENDAEWRYSGGAILPPSQMNSFILKNGFKKVAEFGKFTPQYLSKIKNEEPNPTLKEELNKELLNQPALILYKMDDKYYLPHFYIPNTIITSTQNFHKIPELFLANNYQTKSVFYTPEQKKDSIISSIDIMSQPTLKYIKINTEKYQVSIQNAKNVFPFVFIESFHPDWKLYLGNKIGFFSKPIDEKYHQLANGFVNSWIIDPIKICSTSSCQHNPDGSYNLEFTVEFSQQKFLNLMFIIAGLIFTISAIFVTFNLIKKQKEL